MSFRFRRSAVWDHFEVVVHRHSARCTLPNCGAVIRTGGGSTSALQRHLQSHRNKGDIEGSGMLQSSTGAGEREEDDEEGDQDEDANLSRGHNAALSEGDDDGDAPNDNEFEVEEGSIVEIPRMTEPSASPAVCNKLKSKVWKYFIPAASRVTASCRLCGAQLRTVRGSTSSLRRHLASHKLMQARKRAGRGSKSVAGRPPSFRSGGDNENAEVGEGEEDNEDVQLTVERDIMDDFEISSGEDYDAPSRPHKANRLSSPVWNFFTPTATRDAATCTICHKTVKTVGYSTSGLARHLRMHDINLKEGRGTNREEGEDEEDSRHADNLGNSDFETFEPEMNLKGEQQEMSVGEEDDDDDYWTPENARRKKGPTPRHKSHVWKFFRRTAVKDRSECKFCGVTLSTGGGSTSTLARHLASKHKLPDGTYGNIDGGADGSFGEEMSVDDPLWDGDEGISIRNVQSTRHSSRRSEETCFVCHTKFSGKSVLQCNQEEYHFLFMEILQIPIGVTLDYLAQLERPEKWIAVCQSCQTLAVEGVSIKKKITHLQFQLEKCKGTILKNLVTKISDHHASYPKKQRLVIENIKKFVSFKKYTVVDDQELVDLDMSNVADPQGASCEVSDNDDSEDDNSSQSQNIYATISQPNSSSSKYQKKINLEQPTKIPNVAGPVAKSMCRSIRYRYHCPNCPKVKNYSFDKFVLHMRIHQKRSFQCSVCSEFLPMDEDLREQHWNEKHSSIQQPPGGNKFIQIKFSLGRMWKCDSCLEGFFSEEDRDEHELRCIPRDKQRIRASLPIERRKPRSCEQCDLRFRNVAEWRFHRALHHPEVDSISCYFCDETFLETTVEGVETKHEQKLLDHMTTEHYCKRLYLDCESCGLIFDFGREQKEHMAERHGITENKIYSCVVCSVQYHDVTTLRQHLSVVHFQSSLSVCDLCGLNFLKPDLLLHHKFQTHDIIPEGGKVLTCPHEGCSYTAIFKAKITQHFQRVHQADSRSYVCRFCKKGFKNSTRLKEHVEIHTNKDTKPYQCEVCGSAFAVKSYLYMHRRLKHEDGRLRQFNTDRKRRIRSSKKQNQEAPASDVVTQALTLATSSSASGSTTGTLQQQYHEQPPPQPDNFFRLVGL